MTVKKSIPLFLFVIICISHLNIFDAAANFGARYKKENTQTNSFPVEEEPDTQKEKGKEKSEEQEKDLNRNTIIISQFQLSDKDKFICYSTKLNRHPYKDDDIQPPKAA